MTKKTRKPRRKKAQPSSRGLSPSRMSDPPKEAQALADAIEGEGGAALAKYHEPLGGHAVVLAALPIEKVEPTPFQRDPSEPHVKRLANAMERVDHFLDPIIAVRHDGKYWTPNGNHRLEAMKLLGARSIVALVLPDADMAYQILALNTEKAHNLKERSLEVIRMYRGFWGAKHGNESDFAGLFEEPHFVTFGAAYEKRPRFSAGAYSPLVKKLDAFLELPLSEALAVREKRAYALLEFDDAVTSVVKTLKEKGFDSPYLKNFVVAKVNDLRFRKDETFDFDETLKRMTGAVKKLNAEKIRKEDVARMGGATGESEE